MNRFGGFLILAILAISCQKKIAGDWMYRCEKYFAKGNL
jgi:hypothetical protein